MAIRRNRFVAGVAALGLSTIFGIAVVAPPANAAGGATTLHFYSVTQSLTATSAAGQPVGPTDLFPVGTHFDGTDLLYAGTHQRHTQSFSGSDHLQCVVNVASTVADRQTCTEQFAIGSAMLLANNVTVTFNGRTGTIPINGGTGKYKNARGTLVSTPIANSNNFDNTFSLTGVSSGPIAVAISSGTTLPFFSVQQTLRFVNAAGHPIRSADAGTGDTYDFNRPVLRRYEAAPRVEFQRVRSPRVHLHRYEYADLQQPDCDRGVPAALGQCHRDCVGIDRLWPDQRGDRHLPERSGNL